ncbi:Prolipoprotein diacylglyceryl transferase [uncultured Eubacterium sp.]|uniref:prolipoprotein diacylglyceryl transferase n=1 Tax=Brotomerdimonas butyrica TaxID=2981721 RepID=UPI0008209FE5|nr:prolipoprotein diacylglyceryl transferase [Brotomerdimonas butyrica]MCU6755961.1 prolipoprotein diacylglyceryl transferase [Brotomerdimonas butyrica]SCH58837.1 Prolipoprotein diacylglyceryl transferase [uncultured Eubacterium sp.]
MPVPEPVAFTIFGIDIMWYAVMITSGMIIATVICCVRAPKHDLTSDQIINFVIICIPAAIIGARLYYVVFNWEFYASDIKKILNIRGGGLAIHGGLIFAFVAVCILCAVWKLRPLNVLDLAVPCIAIAQAIGRWGNYFNSEAHGGPTDLPWAITVNGQSVHPTFLYESIWCFLLFFFLIYVDNRRKFEGQTLLLYGILYSAERFFVEALRTDSLMIGPFKQAQVLSLSVIAVCIIAYLILYRRCKNR